MKISEIKNKYRSIDGSMFGSANIESSMAMLYHENSKFTSHSMRTQGEIINEFNNAYVLERCTQPYKCYPGHKTYDLSQYEGFVPTESLHHCLTNRRTVRDFDNEYKISLNEISALLYNSYGVTHKSEINTFGVKGHIGMRNVPSGGGLYPLEVYLVVFNAHIPSGLYHYRADSNVLELIKEGDFMDDLIQIIQAEPYVNMRSASALVVTTGVIERLIIKYGERGYRFLMQESGFVAQTISLLSVSMNLCSCMLGGYHDDMMNDFLGVDGVFETINNIIVLGKEK